MEVRDAPRRGGRGGDPARGPGAVEGARGSSRCCASSPTEDDDEPTLDWLADAERDEAIEFLVELPGVGRKTAACVMIFALGRPEIPVDTHVYRVGGRLGPVPARTPRFERAHDEMLAITDPEDAYELHINLITHGRRVCRPQAAMRGVRPAADVPLVPTPPRRAGRPMRSGRFPLA